MTDAGVVAARPVRRVLVVDDDLGINRLLSHRLQLCGYDVETACDGSSALSLLEQRPPDLIFLDVAMPGIGGMEVLDSVRERGLDTAVVMTTAFGSEQVAVEALRRGADDYLPKPFEPLEFEAALARTVSKLELSRRAAILQRRLQTDLARAAEVQAELLPTVPPAIPGLDVAARCIPARQVGGDFYDWHESASGLLRLTLADVMGKGMAAALLTAAVRSTLRAAADGRTVAETVDVAARSLADDLDRTESFVTLFHAELDPVRRLIRYVDAGHGHAIMIGADGRGELLSSSGMPVGIDEAPYEEHEVELRPGDTLVVYSDGLDDPRWERPDAPNVLALAAHGATSAAEIVDRLTAARADQAEASDDITLLVVRYQPDAEPTPQTNEYGGS